MIHDPKMEADEWTDEATEADKFTVNNVFFGSASDRENDVKAWRRCTRHFN